MFCIQRHLLSSGTRSVLRDMFCIVRGHVLCSVFRDMFSMLCVVQGHVLHWCVFSGLQGHVLRGPRTGGGPQADDAGLRWRHPDDGGGHVRRGARLVRDV